MNQNLFLLSNNKFTDPFLHSQLIDLYKTNNDFDTKYVFCSGVNKKTHNNFKIINNFSDYKSVIGYLKYYFKIFKMLHKHRKENNTIHLRGFVSAVLYYFVPKIFLKRSRYIYDPRGAFLLERLELGNSRLIIKLLMNVEKNLIKKSISTIVTTYKFKDLFIENYNNKDKFTVCYNSSSFKSIEETTNLETLKSINICYCGSVNHWHSLEEITRVTKHIYNIFEKKAKIYFFTTQKSKPQIIAYLNPIPEEKITVKFIPYKNLEEELNKMDVCISVVKPTKSTKIASPIKISDYIMLNKHIILNTEIGDFDDFYKKNNSAILFDFNKDLIFKKEDVFKLNVAANKQLKEKLSVSTNKKIINKLIST